MMFTLGDVYFYLYFLSNINNFREVVVIANNQIYGLVFFMRNILLIVKGVVQVHGVYIEYG